MSSRVQHGKFASPSFQTYNRDMLRITPPPAWPLRAAMCLLTCVAIFSPLSSQPLNAEDSTLQQAATRAMAGRSGTAVVIEVATGKVLAAYHLEVAAQRVTLPGSAIKPFTLLALLEAGKVNARTALMCSRPLTVDGHKLDCTHPDLKQPLDPATALAYSCNSYFTAMATRLTPAELRKI